MRFNLSRALSVALLILIILLVLLLGWAFFRYIGRSGSLAFLLGTEDNSGNLPGTVLNLSASAGDGLVALKWQEPSSGVKATEYHVYRGTIENDLAYLAKTGNLIFSDASVVNGVDYFYGVTAATSNSEGVFSNIVKVRPEKTSNPPVVPPTPTQTVPYGVNDLAAAASGNFVSLAWSAPYNGGSQILKYRIYRSVTPGAYLNSYFLAETNTLNLAFVDDKVISGATYYYRVSAVNAIGEGARAREVSATVGQTYNLPLGVTGLIATPSYNSVSLSWTAVFSANTPITSYKIYRGATPGEETAVNTTNYNYFTDSGLASGTVYYYRVSALNAGGEGNRSIEVPVRTLDYYYPPVVPPTNYTYPGQPQLSISAGEGAAYLSWTTPSDGGSGIVSYRIYRGNYSGGENFLTSVSVNTYNSANSYTATGLNNGQTYYFRVSAVNAVGEGGKSASVSVIPQSSYCYDCYNNYTVPSAPVLSVSKSSETSVYLSWFEPANGGSPITGYKIYRQLNYGPEYLLPNVSVSSRSYSDNSLSAGAYSYRIKAVNGIGESAFSSRVFATLNGVVPPVNPPINPVSSYVRFVSVPSTWSRNSSVTLSWEASSDFVTCRLYFPEYLIDRSPVTVVSPTDSKTFGPNPSVSLGSKSVGIRCFKADEADHVYDYQHLDYWSVSGQYPSTRPNYEQWGTTDSATIKVVN